MKPVGTKSKLDKIKGENQYDSLRCIRLNQARWVIIPPFFSPIVWALSRLT